MGQAIGLLCDPIGVDGPPLVNLVVAVFIGAHKGALDIQLAQGADGVLGGAPGHAGVRLQCGHRVDALGNQVCHIQAAVKT